MNESFTRIKSIASGALLALGAVSCSATESGVESARSSTPANDEEVLTAVQQAMAQAPERTLADFPTFDPNAMVASEKIRNGAPIDYDNVTGNATVLISANTSKGLAACTAQVVNQRMLLTAGHCIDLMFETTAASGSGSMFVDFTNRAGNVNEFYNGPVAFARAPNFRRGDRDLALFALINPMNTCQGTTGSCAASQPDVPQHAVFQFYRPSAPPSHPASYTVVGYGGTDDAATAAGVLRTGSMLVSSGTFTDPASYQLVMGWIGNGAQRVCPIDSGSPVIPSVGERIIHAAFTSNSLGCNPTFGSVNYTGLSEDLTVWVLNNLSAIKTILQLPYKCGLGISGSLALFACDNDGTVFP